MSARPPRGGAPQAPARGRRNAPPTLAFLERENTGPYVAPEPGAGAFGASQESTPLSPDPHAAPAASVAPTAPQAVPAPPSTDASGDALLAAVTASLEDDKAEDIVAIDLRGRSEMGDFMVIASGRSTRQVAAISEHLADRLKQAHGILSRVEGKETGDWVLIDAGDVIVHVFRPEVRDFYQLEKMWLPSEMQARRREGGA